MNPFSRMAYAWIVALLAGLLTVSASGGDLYWDTDGATAGPQGGTGTWDLSATHWWNGSANVAWINDGQQSARLAGSAGTVTLGSDISADVVDFQTTGYKLSDATGRTLTGDLKTWGFFERKGSGVMTIDGDVTVEGDQANPGTFRVYSGQGGILATGDWTGSGQINVKNGASRYESTLFNKGIHAVSGGVQQFSVDIIADNFNDDPVMGARDNSTFRFNGFMKGDQSNDVHVALKTGGRFVIGADAEIDLVNNAYFTRQIWVYGEGAGAHEIELEEGFTADLSEGGTVESGLGSVRLSNATLITNHTRNIPLCKRSDGRPNGHIVFEDAPGSTWRTQTNAQTCISAVWIRQSMTIDTQTDLTHNGETVYWGDYTGYNGFIMRAGHTMTKTGPADLVLTGDQAYDTGTAFDVQEGNVVFRSNPTAGPGDNFTNGQNLDVTVQGTGGVVVEAALVEVADLDVSGGGSVTISAGSELELSNTLDVFAGTVGGSGTIAAAVDNSGGTVAPGSSPGTLTVTGSYTQDAPATLAIEVGGTAPGQADLLDVGGNAILDGDVEVSLAGGFVPRPNVDVFEIMVHGGRSGSFAAVSDSDGLAGLTWDVDYDDAGGRVLLLAQALPGDANLDASVDVGDLGILAGNWNATGAEWTQADFNNDGVVDVGDLGVLAGNWGVGTGVPEPATLTILAGGAMALLLGRRPAQTPADPGGVDGEDGDEESLQ